MIDLEDDLPITKIASWANDRQFYIADNKIKVNNQTRKVCKLRTTLAMVEIFIKNDSAPSTIQNNHTDLENEILTETKMDENGVRPTKSNLNSRTDQLEAEVDVSDKNKVEKEISFVKVLHRRLGHAAGHGSNTQQLEAGILPKPVFHNAQYKDSTSGKFRAGFGESLTDSPKIDRLYADVKDKIKTQSVCGFKYFITINEEYTKNTAVIPIRSKGVMSQALMKCYCSG